MYVLQVAQKSFQGPYDNLEVCGKRHSLAAAVCYLRGISEHQEAEPVLGRGRGRGCECQQGKIWFRLQQNTWYQFSPATDH